MLLEGVYLYLMVVKVFNTAVKIKRYYMFAWGKSVYLAFCLFTTFAEYVS